MARNTLEHRAQDQDDYTQERDETREKALANFLEKLNERNPELVQDLTNERGEGDNHQVSWIRNNGFRNSTDMFFAMKHATKSMTREERSQVGEAVAEAMVGPATKHATEVDTAETQQVKHMLARAIEETDFGRFDQGYRQMSKAQASQYNHTAPENAEAKIEEAVENPVQGNDFGENKQEKYNERRTSQEEALTNFVEALAKQDSSLLKELNFAEQESDKSQLSWVKNNGLENCFTIFQSMKFALRDTSGEERTHVSKKIIESLMTPVTKHLPNHPQEMEKTETSRNRMLEGLESGDIKQFYLGYRRMNELQSFQDNLSNGEKETYREILNQQAKAREEGSTSYRQLLKEQAQLGEEEPVLHHDPTGERAESQTKGPTNYRELLKEQALEQPEEYKQTPLELWNRLDYPESIETYTERAEGQLKILSDKPANMNTFILNMKEKITGRNEFGNGYDLSEPARAEATHKLIDNLRESHPDMVRLIAQGGFPNPDSSEKFTENDLHDQNKAIWDALQKTADSLQDPEDNSIREHLRHTTTRLLTHSATEIIESFNQEHRGWKPESFEDEMEETKSLVSEASRLEKAAADIGWGPGRDLENPMWKQIRQDVFLKEIEVEEVIKKNLFHPKK